MFAELTGRFPSKSACPAGSLVDHAHREPAWMRGQHPAQGRRKQPIEARRRRPDRRSCAGRPTCLLDRAASPGRDRLRARGRGRPAEQGIVGRPGGGQGDGHDEPGHEGEHQREHALFRCPEPPCVRRCPAHVALRSTALSPACPFDLPRVACATAEPVWHYLMAIVINRLSKAEFPVISTPVERVDNIRSKETICSAYRPSRGIRRVSSACTRR